MTSRERAEQLVEEYSLWMEPTVEEITQAISAAIEEERDACARILDVAAEAAKNVGNFTDSQNLRGYAQMIRARSES